MDIILDNMRVRQPLINMADIDINSGKVAAETVAVTQAPVAIISNPGPLGLSGFALTTFVLSFINVGVSGVPNVVIGLAAFYGGLVQLLAGMWEFKTGNTLAATAFSSYGGFWLSFAAIYIPGFGILDAYSGVNASALPSSIGLYLAGWTIFTAICLVGTHRTNVAMVALFFCLTITFLLLTINAFSGVASVGVAGGAFGIITAFIAWYLALAGLLTKETSHFQLPVGPLR